MSPRSSRSNSIGLEICLYGVDSTGFGYIAATSTGARFGNGEPVKGRSATEALYLGCEELRKAGFNGNVWVYAPGGMFRAIASTMSPKSFGSLEWHTVALNPVAVSAETILKRGAR